MARYVISRLAIPAAVVAECIDLKSCKRSELPIYVPECKDELIAAKGGELAGKKPSMLEENVMTVRKTVQSFVNELKYYEGEGLRYINDGVDQAQWLIKYLGEEDNIAPKGPAIAIGGLTGFIFSVRGGIFRKVIFTTAGALGMAAVCYPKEASHYTEVGLVQAKQYITIAYNFVYGVKKDDPPLELPSLPKMPGSVTEAWSMVKSFGQSDSTPVSDGAQQAPQLHQVQQAVGKEGGPPLAAAVSDDYMEISNVVAKTHEEAVQKSCHCPIGACLHHQEEEKAVHPPDLPYPPPNPPDSPKKEKK